jgi:murein DD-endopeptidase MepM/ murein hydrolase activator NlpD
MKHKSEQIIFVVALLVLIGSLFVITDQAEAIKGHAESVENYELTVLELRFDKTELQRKVDQKIVSLEDSEYFYPVDSPQITSGMGLRISPITDVWGVHYGTDLKSYTSMNVYAVRAGIVVTHYPAGNGYWRGHDVFGSLIEIRHKNGISRYGHMKETYVKEGQQIEAGEPIGIIGNEGLSRGKHLHFEYILDIFYKGKG